MGNCACGSQAPTKRSNHITADQQAKVNETTAVVKQQIKEDVKAAIEEAEKLEEEAEEEAEELPPAEKEEKKKEAKRKKKKALKRATKLETLERARTVEAMTLNDYNTAVRRLQSVTGEDPTNPGVKYTLPEGLEWMTAMLEVLWPSIQKYSEKMVRESLQEMMTSFAEWYGTGCQILEFDLGDSSPGFGPIAARKVHGLDGKPDGGVELSLGITWRSNMTLKLDTQAGKVGIQNMDFFGTLYIWIRPFVDDMPLVGGVEVAFINPPTVELDWTGFAGEALELSGLKSKVRTYMNDFLATWMLIPNLIAIPLHESVPEAKLKCPPPEGILRLTILGATNLPDTDLGGGCDPYVEARVGAQVCRTETVKNCKFPVWNKTHDFLVYNQEQWISLNIYDVDKVSSDDLIGSVLHLPVDRIVKRGIAEVPLTKDGLPLVGEDDEGDDSPPCRLRLKAEWVAIKDSATAQAERLVSVHVAEVTGFPEKCPNGLVGPFKVKATVGSNSQETWPGVAKPGSYPATEDQLQLIRKLSSEQKKTPKEIAQLTGLTRSGDDKLVAQALAKEKDGSWTMSVDDSDKAWWKKLDVYMNWQAFPKEKDAEKDKRVWWAGATEEKNFPLCSKEEMTKRKKHYDVLHKLRAWHTWVLWSMMAKQASLNPYYEHVLHINTQDVDTVTLTLLDANNKVASEKTLTVQDDKEGDDPDLVGPFTFNLNGSSQKLTVHGDITVKALEVTRTLPDNWNLRADSLDAVTEFTAWWKDEVYNEDWYYNKDEGKKWTAKDWPRGVKERCEPAELEERVRYYSGEADKVVGSGATPVKEAALQACLRAGAITWGDYDVMAGKLRGEKDMPTIAESLEWVNLLIMCLWPSIKAYATRMVREQVEPEVKKAGEAAGASLKLAQLDVTIPKVDLGTKPPFFNTIQVTKLRGKNGGCNGWGGEYEGMVITLNNLSFVSDIDIQVAINVTTALGSKTINVGLKDVVFRGTVKARLAPMLEDMPMVGAIQVSMPNPPDLAMDFTGLTDIVDKLPGMNSLLIGTVVDQVAAFAAVPNFVVTALDPRFNSIDLAYPRPIGVLRLNIDSAHHLMAGDVSITGAKNSDSYVRLRVGADTFQTPTVTSLDPVWTLNNRKDFVVHDMDQCIDLEVFDADGLLSGGADDSLGAVHSKETVLGGGIDLIRRGIPVRALMRLGAKACLSLSKKEKDEVSSSSTHVVFEEIRIKGEDGQESQLIVTPQWLNIINDGNRNLAYLLQVQVDKVEGLPFPVQANIGPPFRVQASVGVHKVISKPGTGRITKVDAAGKLKMLRAMAKDGESDVDISKALELSGALIERARGFSDEQCEADGDVIVVEWCTEACASVIATRAATEPHFFQRSHLVIPVDRDDEAAQMGRWKAPICLSIINAADTVVATAEIEYDVQANFDQKTQTAATLFGPFVLPIKVEAAKAGLLSYVGMGGAAIDEFSGELVVHGNILFEGLKQRIMDAD